MRLDDFHIPPIVPGKTPAETTVVVAMSGGVDSSAVAGLLHHLGYRTIGVTLQLWDYTPASDGGTKKFGTCCALDDVYDARRVCQTLGIPHYVLNYEGVFKENVIDDFVETYMAGATPIPCVRCNQRIKFAAMLEKAKKLGADALATGHYVRKLYAADGTATLHRGVDPGKDQSYFLFATTQAQLDFCTFPLGHLDKSQTRELAKDLGLHVNGKKDSQDICFVPAGDYRKVVRKFAPEAAEKGTLVDEKGNVLGEHDGIINFTVGQRRGLGQAFGSPMYVLAIRPDTREVVLGPREALLKRTFTVREMNWLQGLPKNGDLTVKVRAAHTPSPAEVADLGEGRIEVTLFNPEEAIAPGQAAVFYNGERLLGGGWIENPEKAVGPTKVRIEAA